MQSKGKSIVVVFIVLIIGFIMGALTSGALRNRRIDRIRHMGPQEKFERVLYDIVKPNEEQRNKLERVFEKYAGKMASIHDEQTISIMNVMDSLRTEVNSILTGEQKERFQQHMSQFHERFVRMQLNRIDRAVDLTEEQKSKIRKIFENHRELLPDMPGGKNRPRLLDIRSHFEKFDQEIKEILTPEQYEQYRRLKEERRGGPGFFQERGRHPGKKRFMD
jgi:Spy/CpxP family protein refolding chaperone